ncbi:two-component regulator propeller domain-containing protein, partial [Bacteroidota bacterium]
MKRYLLPFILFATSAGSLFGQSFQIMRFGIEDGLCHESTYTMNQDSDGFLWVGTSQGLCRFDGKSFTSDFIGDPLPSAIANTSFIDGKGRAWFGYMDGLINCFSANRMTLLEPAEGARFNVIGFIESQGKVIAITQQSGLIVINDELSMSYD